MTAKTKKKGGLLFGLLLIILGSVILINNEKNSVNNIKTVNQISKEVVEVQNAKVLSSNEGKLVAVSGNMVIKQDKLYDPIFNVSVKTPKLDRIVEVYQWIEEDDEADSSKKVYKKEWSKEIINSKDFKESSTHKNPESLSYENESYYSDVYVGEFKLDSKQVEKMSANKDLNISNMTGIYLINGFKIVDNYLVNSYDYSKPQIGDTRISYKYNDYDSISVLAVQSNNTFKDFISDAGKTINKVYSGKLNSTQIIDKITNSNNATKWLFRGLGILITIVGYISLFSFLTNLLDYIPVLGSIASGAIKLVASIIGFIQSLIIIIIAWFRYRPVLSLILIVIIVGLIILVRTRITKKSTTVVEEINE